MILQLQINGQLREVEAAVDEKLLDVLRRLGYLGVKSGGCKRGECGACTVLLDGKAVNSCMFLAVQAVKHEISTIEALGTPADQGWKQTEGLSPLQSAFIQNGSIQCGYCSSGMILASKALLDRNPDPSEAEVREALSGILCRCTAYVKPVEAVLQAAAMMRSDKDSANASPSYEQPKIVQVDFIPPTQVIGKSSIKVDAEKLAQGESGFYRGFYPAWHFGRARIAQPCGACPHCTDKYGKSESAARRCRGADLGRPAARGVLHCRPIRPDSGSAGHFFPG